MGFWADLAHELMRLKHGIAIARIHTSIMQCQASSIINMIFPMILYLETKNNLAKENVLNRYCKSKCI
jgi:hypothetical protein